MEFKKGDRVVHLGLKLVGTFIEYAWNSDEEAIVKFEIARYNSGRIKN